MSVFSCSSFQRSVLSLCVDASLWAHGSEDDVVSSGVLHHVPPPGGAMELGLAFTSGQAMRQTGRHVDKGRDFNWFATAAIVRSTRRGVRRAFR